MVTFPTLLYPHIIHFGGPSQSLRMLHRIIKSVTLNYQLTVAVHYSVRADTKGANLMDDDCKPLIANHYKTLNIE